MNLALLDPFSRKQYPEHLDTYIYEPGAFALLTKFNRRGTLLATGTHNGTIVVWDFLTRSKALVVHTHSHPITSLSWSRDQRRLLSSSLDWKVKLWHVESGVEELSFDVGEPVLNACIHPRNHTLCAVAPAARFPELIDLATGTKKTVPVSENTAKVFLGSLSFDREGRRLYWGDTQGKIHEVDVETWKETNELACNADSVGVKQIVFNRKGNLMLANCNDRKIRLFDVETRECIRVFVDPVKRNMWKTCRFSGDSEYVIAGSAEKAEHHIYIWDRYHGNLVKTIEGPKEGILDLQWHPFHPVICSCASTSGVILIWTTNYTEHWSAYAPNFTELHENEVYQEREDEFDVMDSEEYIARKRAKQEEEEEKDVDVLAIAPVEGLSSEEEGDLLGLAAAPPKAVRADEKK